MPTIAGNAFDVGTTPLGPSTAAQVCCRIKEAARGSGGVHFTKDLFATCSPTGAFSFSIPDYSGNPSPVMLQIGARWQNPDGYQSGLGFSEWSWLPPMHAPNVDITVAELLEKQFGNDIVYVAADALNRTESTGFQLNTVTFELFQRVG